MLGVLALVVVATNAFALLFLLPSLHAWLWLPQLRESRWTTRAAVFVAGLAGPLLVLGSFAIRYGVGLDVPWYVANLAATGYVDVVSIVTFLAWLAAAGQLAALASRRYAPYPSAAERSPRGPFRQLVRRNCSASVQHAGGGRRCTSRRPTFRGVRRSVRILGTVMIGAGVLGLIWALLVWQWQDPFTAVYTHLEQRKLASGYEQKLCEFEPPVATAEPGTGAKPRSRAAAPAPTLAATGKIRGEAVGRLTSPGSGSTWSWSTAPTTTRSEGAGPLPGSSSPARASSSTSPATGRRTRRRSRGSRRSSAAIRSARAAVRDVPVPHHRHVIVEADALEVLKSEGREVIALQACHPRFFATHRYIAYAEPARRPARKGARRSRARRSPRARADSRRKRRARRPIGPRRAARARARRPPRPGRSCASPGRRGARSQPSRRRLRARTSSSRPGLRRTGAASGAGRTRARVADALERQHRGPDEELEADERRDRVARQAEDERRAAHAEGDRLARLDRDAPEHLLDAELGRDAAHEIVRPDRHAARGHEHVRLEPARERLAVSRLGVVRPCPSRSAEAPARERGHEQGRVRLVDLARGERLSGRAQLVPGGEHRRARALRGRRPRARRPRRARRSERGRDASPPRAPRRRAHVAAARTNARTSRRSSGISTVSSATTTYSMGTTASAPSGTAPPVAIRIASPGPSGRVAGAPAAIRATIGKRPGVSADRTANPSIAELGNGGRSTTRAGGLGEHAAGGMTERDRLHGQRADALEDERLGLLDREQVGHAAIILLAVLSVVVPVRNEEQSVGRCSTSLRARSTLSATGRRSSSTTARPTARSPR